MHAGAYAFAHRKDKKSDRRRLWQVKINAASRAEGVSFSKLIGALKKKNVLLNRKMLSELAVEHPETFKKVLAHVK
jgi:large subunit ribosomal protein L20